MKQAEIIVSGKVQGVFFRVSSKNTAERLGIVGYVRNLPDGNVFIFASGKEDDIERFVSWCGEGPAGASVKKVTVKNLKSRVGEYDSFSIKI